MISPPKIVDETTCDYEIDYLGCVMVIICPFILNLILACFCGAYARSEINKLSDQNKINKKSVNQAKMKKIMVFLIIIFILPATILLILSANSEC